MLPNAYAAAIVRLESAAIMDSFSVLAVVGIICMGIGLIGVIVPLLPGLPLIWVGILLWAWGDGFVHLGWPTLLVLAVLMAVGWGIDLLLAPAISRRSGVSWRAIGGALVGGLVGGIVLSAIPVIGTLFGALLGAIGGMWLVEYRIRNDQQAATTAVLAYLRGVAVATLLELLIAFLMIAIFLWQAFWA